MTKAAARMTLVHHAGQDIGCPANEAWRSISDGAKSGQRFARQGYTVAAIENDPAAYLGGYRMWLGVEEMSDERICHVTEWDEAAMRFSIRAQYLDPAERGTEVYSSYSIVSTAGGCRYLIDCHASFDMDIDDDATHADIRAMMTALAAEHTAYLDAGLDKIRTELEC